MEQNMIIHIVLKTKDLYDEGRDGFETSIDSVWDDYEKATFRLGNIGGNDPFSDTKYEIESRTVNS